MDAPSDLQQELSVTTGFCQLHYGGTRSSKHEVPAAPTQGMGIPALQHNTCTSALLSWSLFTGTQRICALLCTQRATLGYNSSVLCLNTSTCTLTTISTNPATQPPIWARSRERKGTLKPNPTRALIAPEWRYYGYFPTARTQPQNLPPGTMRIPWDFSVAGDPGRCVTLPLSW